MVQKVAASRLHPRLRLLLAVAAGCCTVVAAAQPTEAALQNVQVATPVSATASTPQPLLQPLPQPNIGANVMDVLSKLPVVRLPILPPNINELLKLENLKAIPQNVPLPVSTKLNELMAKLPTTMPGLEIPTFGPNTTDAEYVSNVTAATAGLMSPLLESTVLPSYITGLRARVVEETAWLHAFSNDTSKQAGLCGIFGTKMSSCVAFVTSGQSAKIQALTSGLDVLNEVDTRLNTEMANKLAAFNVPSRTALGNNWLCEVGGDLSTAIHEAAEKSASASYASKATNAHAKLNDFITGRWGASPWWQMKGGTKLSPLASAPCPIVS